jgi:hypothetical protein
MTPCSLVERYNIFGITSASIYHEVAGSWFVHNVVTYLPDYTVSYLRNRNLNVYRHELRDLLYVLMDRVKKKVNLSLRLTN